MQQFFFRFQRKQTSGAVRSTPEDNPPLPAATPHQLPFQLPEKYVIMAAAALVFVAIAYFYLHASVNLFLLSYVSIKTIVLISIVGIVIAGLYIYKPQIFQKLIRFIILKIKWIFFWIEGPISRFIEKYHTAGPQERHKMIIKPLIVIILAIIIIAILPLFIPPAISTSFPGNNGAEVPLDAHIEIIFNKEMSRRSVEKGFSITPDIPGTFLWENNQKLIFTPKHYLNRAAQYTVRINRFALSTFFMPLIGTNTIQFETLGNPKVVVASPSDETLGDLAPITVIFDRAMIPLTTANNSAVKQSAFTVSPEIAGEGRWLGTTAYQFRPTENYKKATTYTVTIPKGLSSQDGGQLTNGYSWTFSSEKPRVINISPDNGYQFTSPTASIAAFFNQDIAADTIASKFVIYDEGHHKVDGHVLINGHTAGFYPAVPLQRQKYYTAVIEKGAQGIEGPNGMEEDHQWTFSVAPLPKITGSDPFDKSKDVTKQNFISVNFVSPMDADSFKSNVTIDPAPDIKPSFNFSDYNNTHSLDIGTYIGRSKHYTITIGPEIKDVNGTSLGYSYTFSFDTAPYQPALNIMPFNTYFGAFNQQVIPRIITQTVNTSKLAYSLFKLKREDLLDLYRRRYTEQCGDDNSCRNWQSYDTSKLEKIHSWNETFSADKNNPVDVVTKVTMPNGNNIPSGFYFLDINIPQGAHDNMVMIVSKSTLTVKKSDNQLFAWSVNQSDSSVIPDMQMELTDSNGTVLTNGTTNNDGVLMKNINLFQKDNLFVFGQKDNDIVVAGTEWNDGINIYDFGLPSFYNASEQKDYNTQQDYKQYVTLDRPIYRPGQTLYFKGVVRKDTDGAYAAISPQTPINVVITDADNRQIYSKTLNLTSFGSFSDSFALSKNGNLGMYQISSTFNGNTYTQQFQVEEYKKQDLSVTVNPSKDNYLQGETADISINASYYFGAPVSYTPVTWTVQTQDFPFKWNKDVNYEFGDPDSYWDLPWYGNNQAVNGKKVTEGKGTTDGHGDLNVSLPLDISQQKTSQTYILEADVNDNNNQSIAASKQFVIHKASVYAGLKPESYGSSAGQAASVDVVTVDYKGNETGDTPVLVSFYKRTWDTVREQNPDDGQFYYTSKSHDALVNTTTVTTNALGRALAAFTPTDGGTYKVTATVTDKNGNTNTSGSFLWVWGDGFTTQQENNDRIVVVTDKQEYNTGDSISVFVASPFASSSAKTLLTAERGSVLDYKVVDTNNKSNNFKLTANDNYTPNAFIGAVLIKGGSDVKNPAAFKIGYAPIKVTNPKKHVIVTITTDKKRYKPQDKLHAVIQTKDLNGNPISTEVAVGLVDKAAWDLSQVEMPEIYKTFYEPRNLSVSTAQLLTISIDRVNANTNLGAKGGSGGGGSGGVDTSRRNFPDTAYWNPNVLTDKIGRAEVNISLPDSLTTWRLGATANSSVDAFGSNTSEVIVSRDLLIRPFLPRFLSVGDQAQLGAIIVNTSGSDQHITTTIKTDGVQVNDSLSKQQTIRDGGQVKVLWPTTALNTKKAKITITVDNDDGNLHDAMEVSLPIQSYSVPETVATAGEAKTYAQEKITLPKELDRTQGSADISLSPVLGAAGLNALSYLYSYPYFCTEQTTSKLMPSVYAYHIMREKNLTAIDSITKDEVSAVITDGIQRLNTLQHGDGGWGWWTEDPSDPFLSAYAYSGLLAAKKERLVVSDLTLQSVRNYLEGALSLPEEKLDINTRTFILYVLKDNSSNLASYADNLYERRFELSVESRAYLALAIQNIPGMENKRSRLVRDLVSLVRKTATTSHWEEGVGFKQNYSTLSGTVSTTSHVLEAILSYDKNNPLIPEAVRYLLTTRKDNHWPSTFDTAAAIKSLALVIESTADQTLDESYKASVKGKTIASGKFTDKDIFSVVEKSLSITDFTIPGDTNVQFAKSGAGNLYYNINLNYFLPFTEIASLDSDCKYGDTN